MSASERRSGNVDSDGSSYSYVAGDTKYSIYCGSNGIGSAAAAAELGAANLPASGGRIWSTWQRQLQRKNSQASRLYRRRTPGFRGFRDFKGSSQSLSCYKEHYLLRPRTYIIIICSTGHAQTVPQTHVSTKWEGSNIEMCGHWLHGSRMTPGRRNCHEDRRMIVSGR